MDFSPVYNLLKQESLTLYRDSLVSIAIFGSSARNTAMPDSDLDILMIAEKLPKGRIARIRQFDIIEQNIDINFAPSRLRLSPIFKTPEEARVGSPLFWDMTEHAIILYDKNDFLRGILDATRESLARNGARKIVRGNAWYWVLKEKFEPGEVFSL